MKKNIKDIILKVMNYMLILDELQYTKGEMQHPYKHILIIKENKNLIPMLIDFERCKKTLNPKNVTQFAQYLMSSPFSKLIENKDFVFEQDILVPLCKQYKSKKRKDIFNQIINYIKSK